MNAFSFKLRGSRDYVLVADILDGVLHELYGHGRTTCLDYTVKQPCRAARCILIDQADATPADHLRALALYRDSRHDVLIMPGGEPTTERCPCDEHLFAADFMYGKDAQGAPCVAVASLPKQASLARCCVAAFKYLLNTSVMPEPRRYLFARLQLENTNLDSFSISYQRLFAGRFYEGRIMEGGQVCGHIYFSGGGA